MPPLAPTAMQFSARGGATEIELPFEGPALQQSIDKSGAENISGSSRIDRWNTIRGDAIKLLSIPRDHAILSQRCRRQARSIAALHLTQRFLQIGLVHKPACKIPVHDQIVDVLEKIFNSLIKVVEVGDYRYAGSAGPAGRNGCRGRIVTVDEKGSRVYDPFAIEVARLKDKALIPPVENRPLAPGRRSGSVTAGWALPRP